jgi:biotin operon repressor
MKNTNQEIAALLLRGSADAIPLQQLQALTGLDGRTVRRLIQKERQSGACICCNSRGGYFLAETEAERDTCARSMLHRAAEIKRTAEAIAAAEVE